MCNVNSCESGTGLPVSMFSRVTRNWLAGRPDIRTRPVKRAALGGTGGASRSDQAGRVRWRGWLARSDGFAGGAEPGWVADVSFWIAG
jgi:hypothetical protein